MLLTVGILSYNRPKQLYRCLKSLLPLPNDVNVIVYDDCSPKLDSITKKICGILKDNGNITFTSNKNNVGYDVNLLNCIVSSNGKYVLLMSDDDWLESGALLNIRNTLYKQTVSVAFVRYCETNRLNDDNGNNIKRTYSRNFNSLVYFKPGSIVIDGSLLYNSILFSGLIFNRSLVCSLADNFHVYYNSIYIQVALFAIISNEYGSMFISGPGVVVGSDGDNGFGSNLASEHDGDLSDRSTIHSNLKFNRRLINLVNELSKLFGDKYLLSFYKEFNLRNFSGMRYARNMSRSSLVSYWVELGTITRYRNIYHFIVYFIMLALPKHVVNSIVKLAVTFVRSIRSNRQ